LKGNFKRKENRHGKEFQQEKRNVEGLHFGTVSGPSVGKDEE